MRVTERAHQVVSEVVEPGECVIDATAGNGHDTLFLAKLVGAQGQVLAFDVQESAIESTQRRLAAAGINDERVSLIRASHASLQDHCTGPVAAVMFNLGYLPGSDRQLTTTSEVTLQAIAAAWSALREGGILSVVCYRGHKGGAEEAKAVTAFANALEGARVEIIGQQETDDGPFLVAITKER